MPGLTLFDLFPAKDGTNSTGKKGASLRGSGKASVFHSVFAGMRAEAVCTVGSQTVLQA